MRIAPRYLQIICVIGVLMGIAEIGLGLAWRNLAAAYDQMPAETRRSNDELFRDRVLNCDCGPTKLALLKQFESLSDNLLGVAAKAHRGRSNSSIRRGSINAALFGLLLYGLRGRPRGASSAGLPSGNAL